jgi:Spy/CpxP family protein refolding chaperone
MTSANRLWLAIFVLVVFVTGAFAGALVDRRWRVPEPSAETMVPSPERPGMRGRGAEPGEIAQRNTARLERALNLTPEQRGRVLDILQRRQARLRQLQEESRQLFVDEQRTLQDEISAVLTPEQRDRFQTLRGRLLGPPRGRGPVNRGEFRGGR